jgi:chromate transporter
VAGAAGTVVPTTLLMLAAVAYFYKIKDAPPLRAMLTAVRPVVIGLLLWTAYDVASTVFKAPALGWGPALAANWDKLLIVAVTFGLLTFTKINPVFIILGAAVLGLLLYR